MKGVISGTGIARLAGGVASVADVVCRRCECHF